MDSSTSSATDSTKCLSERDEQIRFTVFMRRTFPAALWTTSTAGDVFSVKRRVAMIKSGYRAGTPDIMIFEARGAYHGLFIELKRTKGGRVTPAQRTFHEKATLRGYHCVVARGWAQAACEAQRYLNIQEEK